MQRTLGSKNEDSLFELRSERGKHLADLLRELLEEFEFDKKNRLLRPDQYAEYPTFPWFAEAEEYFDDVASNGLNIVERQLLKFFLLGESVPETLFPSEFGSLGADFLSLSQQLGLCFLEPRGLLRLNGLFLGSKNTSHGDRLYLLGDLPRHYPSSLKPVEVELEGSSYSLSDAITSLSIRDGIAAEFGCGGGIQLMSAAIEHPSLSEIHGYDLFERQRSVALFISHLNLNDEEAQKVVIHKEQKELLSVVQNGTVDLGIIPSFLAVPPPVPITERQAILIQQKEYLVDIDGVAHFDFHRYLGKTAWGGTDGLTVTVPLVEQMLPLIGKGGVIVAAGDYAFGKEGPLIIQKLSANPHMKSFGWRFEKSAEKHFPWTPLDLVDITLQELSACVPGVQKARLGTRLKKAVCQAMGQAGIEYIHGGVLLLERR